MRSTATGHGTHVAGIIAGQCEAPLPGVPATAPLQFAGMAPLARLYGLKVLDDDGNGRDSWIIKGVQQVAELNERAGELVVHGVNLSLGGYFGRRELRLRLHPAVQRTAPAVAAGAWWW